MAHEQSGSHEWSGGKWANVVGPDARPYTKSDPQPGQRLKPLFPYEKDWYDTEGEASHAAKKRSEDFGEEVGSVMERHSAFNRLMKEK